MRRVVAILTVLVSIGCDATQPPPPPDAGSPQTAGHDVDDRTPRALTTSCPLPQAFYDGLGASSVATSALTLPDFGLTFAKDINRFHWTDDVRHQGDLAPELACMVASDVRTALALGDSETTVRELLVAQGIYGNRDTYQVSRYDRAITVDANAQPLMAVLQQFFDHPQYDGDTSTPLGWADVQADAAAQVATFSPHAQVAIAQAILGLLAAADLRDQAFTQSGALDFLGWQAQLKTYFLGKNSGNITTFGNAYKAANAMTAATDYDLLSRAGQLAARSVESLRIALATEPLTPGATLDLTGSLGRIAISLQQSDDTWAGRDFFLLVDAAGNDTYQDDIAVSELFRPIAVVLDLAGNDRYVQTKPYDPTTDKPPTDHGRGTGQAAGWMGVAILDDAAGDDVYETEYYQAYSAWGVSALVDHGGTDTYKGYVHSQGASEYGYALLVDLGGGSDHYETLHTSQGYGGPRGIGWLVDDAGDDTYTALTTLIDNDPNNAPYDQEGSNFSGAQGFGFGLRVWDQNGNGIAYLSGGMGALFDFAGNDTYVCATMCQAWGYFFGTGLLWDESGNDSYTTWHKYGIGGATHQAIGVFVDAQGADTYEYTAGGIATNGGCEGVGLGYDASVGFHIDRGLDADTYKFDADKQQWGEVLGISRFVGIGVLLNEGGDDQYHLPGVMGAYALGMTDMPYSSPPYRSTANGTATTISLGMFLDLGGTDTYDATGSPAANDASWKQTATTTNSTTDPFDPSLDHGYGFDGQSTWAAW